MLVVIWNYIS